MAHRILWSRFINTKGGKGHNISCDLQMEHLNLAFKTHLGTAGGNVTEKSLKRTGKALSTLFSVTEAFDSICSIETPGSAHSHKSTSKDEETMVSALLEHHVFSAEGDHSHFVGFPFCYFNRINKLQNMDQQAYQTSRTCTSPKYTNSAAQLFSTLFSTSR